jgi:hypothetical protein
MVHYSSSSSISRAALLEFESKSFADQLLLLMLQSDLLLLLLAGQREGWLFEDIQAAASTPTVTCSTSLAAAVQ